MTSGVCTCGSVVSSSTVLVAGVLCTVGYKVGTPWIIIFQVCPMDDQLYLDWGNYEATLSSFLGLTRW